MEKEKVITVTVKLKKDFNTDYENKREELKQLVIAMEAEVVSEVSCSRDFIDKALYIGKGKAEEIRLLSETLGVDTIVFNNELSGSQMKNLEEIIDRKIVDRTNLILDIFATRAKTKEAVLQVQLAQMEYMLPRLVGLRKNLSKASAGIGTRGLGEQKLELDRRKISKEIDRVKNKLKKVEKTRETNRKSRVKNKTKLVSLVGYTNAGKSTIANELSNFYNDEKTQYFAKKDMLFMTLDTTIRKGLLPQGSEFLIADTVGFIEDISTNLIESFKSTLEEIKYSDCILHVIDSSSNNMSEQIDTTYKMLKELDVLDKPIINIYNKMDIKKDLIYKSDNIKGRNLYISSYKKEDIFKLLKEIESALKLDYEEMILEIPYDKQGVLAELRNKDISFEIEYDELMKVKMKVLKTEINHVEKYLREKYEL
ncbi:GTPase HflX [Miniphocaeibacter massiliensis]|uniref:GTPase HflX n=1 Tax=Miniphocaeibacter massiliensis TaxID=2041841 RepID=UPI000C08D9DE|nr:GTPase HflX [Miniphocaeibacter massiliensis]